MPLARTAIRLACFPPEPHMSPYALHHLSHRSGLLFQNFALRAVSRSSAPLCLLSSSLPPLQVLP